MLNKIGQRESQVSLNILDNLYRLFHPCDKTRMQQMLLRLRLPSQKSPRCFG